MRCLPAALVIATLLVGVVRAVPALAQPAGGVPASNEEDRRTRLFKEGKAAADAGKWAEAADKFRQVVAIRSAPKALIALGVAEERLGRVASAHAEYRRAREEAADKSLVDELKTANAALEAIRPRLPKVVFSPSDALAGARIEIDGEAARPDDGVLFVNPGEHTVSATASGKGTFKTTISLEEGQQHEIELVFTPASAAVPTASGDSPAKPPDSAGSGRPPTGAVVVGGLGIVSLVVGGALWGIGSGQYDQSDKKCPGPGCSQAVLDQGNAGRDQIIGGVAFLGVGAAALAGAGIWWITSAASSKKTPATSLFLAPRPGGLTITGSF